ncbi:hypothetical protein EV363DRAFT_1454795 [Boletus edulis]|nr:hypothetical protein EV363DRAFT_1454795 [Boletus edulis]
MPPKPLDESMNPLNKPLHMEDVFNLNLCALLSFAGHCPRLCMLGLYINATEAEIPSSHTPLEPFHVLRTLSLGTLQVRHMNVVAMFLSWVCPVQCQLNMGITWIGFGTEDNWFLPLQAEVSTTETVFSMACCQEAVAIIDMAVKR